MKKPAARANDTIYQLRQQIHGEDNRRKLGELVLRLQYALNHEKKKIRSGFAVRAPEDENPFDSVIVG